MSCRRSCDRSSCGCGGCGGCGGCNSCSSGCGGYDHCDRPNVLAPFVFAFLAVIFGLFFLEDLSTQNRAEPYSTPPLEQPW